jgi:hypothetical protein
MGERLPTEKASSTNIAASGASHPAKVETTAVSRTTEQAGLHEVVPPATAVDATTESQRPSLSDITALLGEMRVLLRHVLHRQNRDAHSQSGAIHPDGQPPSPLENVHVELLTIEWTRQASFARACEGIGFAW